MPTPAQIESALAKVKDWSSFQSLLIDTLGWNIEEAPAAEDITYGWTKDELRAADLDNKLFEGKIRQFPPADGCPWGIFLLEFNTDAPFADEAHGRGMTDTLRKVLRGLVPSKRKSSHLASFTREHLLFICTHKYKHFRFAYFRDPGEDFKTPPLISFGWTPGGGTKTVSRYNLPHLEWQPKGTSATDWIAEWTSAFDVERVTKKFFAEFEAQHQEFLKHTKGIADEGDRRWYVSALLNRLMFVYFLQKKGFVDGGKFDYLESKLAECQKAGNNRFFEHFLKPLFFEGFAKPESKRSAAVNKVLGSIKYLNGGLFLPHPVEQKYPQVEVTDAPFKSLFDLFAQYSWNLDDTPGGSDNEINPDVLGYIFEKYINQKEFGAYYTRPEITDYLCEKTIHRLVLDKVNTPANLPPVPGVPHRDYATVGDMLARLDSGLAERLLDEILPGISLLDPACGSGAFLIAALKAMIDIYTGVFGWVDMHGSPALQSRLAAIKKDHASLAYFIKHRIISKNIYGVDLMAEATEIARLRLFLALVASAHKVEDLEPLPNIDFNVLAGNSLIGLIKIDEGDFDKKGRSGIFASHYRDILAKKNRLTSSYRDATTYSEELTGLRDSISKHNDEAIAVLNDLLLTEMQSLEIKYHELDWDEKKRDAVVAKKRALLPRDVVALKPFHWAYVFDDIMVTRGGFDAIITNPPWEIFKPNGKEFFENHSELITKKSMTIHDFEKEQAALLKDKDVRSAWIAYLEQFPHVAAYFRSADQFRNQISIVNGKKAGTDTNLFKLFTEQCYRLLRPGGHCGIVIPSGIYTDLGAKQLREMLFGETRVTGLVCFENRRGIFENVDSRFKFVVLTFEKGGTTDKFPAAFMRHEVSELRRFPFGTDTAARGQVEIDVATARRLAPDSLSIMEFKSALDVTIAEKMLKFPLLGSTGTDGWNVRLTAEFHMTNDSHLFHDRPAKGRLPLYEGKMIWQFDHKYAEPRYWVDEKEGRKAVLGRTADDGRALDYQSIRLAHRSIASNTNERSFILAAIPAQHFLGNSLNYWQIAADPKSLLWLMAFGNSFVFDYKLRQSVTTNINTFFVYQSPVPMFAAVAPFSEAVITRVAKLACTTPEFDEFAQSVGLKSHKQGATDLATRAKLRAEIDGLVAHLYGLSEDEFAHVLKGFPIVADQIKTEAMNAYRDFRSNPPSAAPLANPAETSAPPVQAASGFQLAQQPTSPAPKLFSGPAPSLNAAPQPAASFEPDKPEAHAKIGRAPSDSPLIDDMEEIDLLSAIRSVFGKFEELERGSLAKEVSRELGFDRLGPNITAAVDEAINIASRRKIIRSERGVFVQECRTISDYTRDELVEFLAATMRAHTGPSLWDREEAIRLAARHLGFKRTGPQIVEEFKSAINAGIRREVFEREGAQIRLCSKS